jgi:hypothetical protein
VRQLDVAAVDGSDASALTSRASAHRVGRRRGKGREPRAQDTQVMVPYPETC